MFVGSQNTDKPFVGVAVHSQLFTLPVQMLYMHTFVYKAVNSQGMVSERVLLSSF